ncbi:calcium-transporting ATPase [Aureococcus anophagefferens]|nr:calcium-transporting ATPase [Aureococcus anophagefferens]
MGDGVSEKDSLRRGRSRSQSFEGKSRSRSASVETDFDPLKTELTRDEFVAYVENPRKQPARGISYTEALAAPPEVATPKLNELANIDDALEFDFTNQAELHNIDKAKLAHELRSDLERGLPAELAAEKLAEDGPNELEKPPRVTFFVLFLIQLSQIITLLLIAACVASACVNATDAARRGSALSYVDSIAIFIIVFLNAYIAAASENAANGALEALDALSSPVSVAVRDGEEVELDSTKLVVGDVILLATGDVVPADCRVVRAADLKVNEMLLTGESEDVSKTDKVKPKKPGAAAKLTEDTMIFSSCTVKAGNCRALVVHTGMRTRVGQIAALLTDDAGAKGAGCLPDTKGNMTPLQVQLEKLAVKIGVLAIACCVIVFVVGAAMEVPDPEGNVPSWLYMILIAVTLTVAAIPEGLPLTVTISLSTGCSDMVKENVLGGRSRRRDARLASVICTDKTGTLTEGKMRCVKALFGGEDYVVSGRGFDPTVGSIDATVDALSSRRSGSSRSRAPLRSLPYDDEADVEDKLSAILGGGLTFLGLVASIDPERQGVKAAIATANSATVRTVMITGDYLKTAQAIARNIGILAADGSQDGDAVDCGSLRPGGGDDYLSEPDMDALTLRVNVFARAKPEDKLEIVKSLQRQGFVSAMTGDGVNDAPALKEADIGVSMGLEGTEVAKGASDMILTDDNFCSIVKAVEKGRGIYSGIEKFVSFIMSVHFAEVLQIFLCVVSGLPIMREPLQILFLVLVTDLPPAIALGVEPPEKGLMDKKPRPKAQPVIMPWMWKCIIANGMIMTAGITATYVVALHAYAGTYLTENIDRKTRDSCVVWGSGMFSPKHEEFDDAFSEGDDDNFAECTEFAIRKARTVAFIALVWAENIRAYTARSFTEPIWVKTFSNPTMNKAIASAQAALCGNSTDSIQWWGWVLAAVGAVACGAGCELYKLYIKLTPHVASTTDVRADVEREPLGRQAELALGVEPGAAPREARARRPPAPRVLEPRAADRRARQLRRRDDVELAAAEADAAEPRGEVAGVSRREVAGEAAVVLWLPGAVAEEPLVRDPGWHVFDDDAELSLK